ncbi:MAG: homoserine kinase [Chloroflexi bacterium]|nr:homoserine kinase [Chloroflexota bacterium]
MQPSSAPPPRRVTVEAPASTANLGPGFDCLGLALDLADEVTVTLISAPLPAADAGGPEAAHRDLIRMAATQTFAKIGLPAPHLDVVVRHVIPIGKGLGSSAAAICAGVVAANTLAGGPLSDAEVLQLACDIEGHPDNTTPAMLGGFRVAILEEGRVIHTRVALPDGLGAVLFSPDFAMPTHETRKLLPTSLSRADVVFQTGRAALLVAALAAGDLDKLRLGVQDRLHQPARGQVFPAMFPLFAAAEEAGALAAYLSGGGPTVCALTQGREQEVAAALRDCATRNGVGGEVRVTRPRERGTVVVSAGV